jgi:uncharacterized repeat protein (TIGR03803 family)
MVKNRIRNLAVIAVLGVAAIEANTPAHAQKFSVLYNFRSNGPIQPQPAVIAQGWDGNLYSTTERGGTGRLGTAFRITPAGKLTVIYNFNSSGGQYPTGGLTLGTDGNLYGATQAGGTFGCGIVFNLTPVGKLTVLHNFANSEGCTLLSPPVQGSDGNFYGGTSQGGGGNYGTLYQITPSGGFTTLYTFNHSDGAGPDGALVQGTDGDFYGTTIGGGNYGYGTVFKVTSNGQLTTLHMFDGTDGNAPSSALVEGTDRDFYGATTMGGSFSQGTLFKITSNGNLTVLYTFTGGSGKGYDPEGGLAVGTDGAFYGTAYQGGTTNAGTIYRITPQGKFSDIHNFDVTHGGGPLVTLFQGTKGFLYGDTYRGGTSGFGVFYSQNARLRAFAALIPSSGKIGETIGILGQGFTGATGVSFNGTPATFTVVSGTYLKATVPNGATTGFVIVTTPRNKLKSNKPFAVTQ